MRNKEQPYSIPCKREISVQELQLLKFLLKSKDEYLSQIPNLRVVGRCGCGECPTVLFGESFNAKPNTEGLNQIVENTGQAQNGTIVGVAVIERAGLIAELEAWSVCGGDVEGWPSVEALCE